MIEEWSGDLSYEKVSKLLTQVTGNKVLSPSGVQSYIECKATSISEEWVSSINTDVKEIAVISDILLYDSDEPEIILMMDDVGVKAQKPHKKVARQTDDAKRLDTTVILVQDSEKAYHYATQGIDKTGKTIYSVEQAIVDKVSQLHDLSNPLPIELSMSEDTVGLKAAYGVFKEEALAVDPSYNPLSVNLDGWKATNQDWLQMFPSIKIILCYLHAFLKIRDIGKGLKERFYEVGTEVWTAYREKTKQGFLAALVNLNTWTQTHFTDNLKICQKVGDLCAKAERFTPAYDFEDCYRTSNQIDRPMNAIDRYLYQMRYFKGHRDSANNKIRAWAILYNFAPFSERVQKRKENPKKMTRFEQYNGFVYHKNWLHNLLIAASLNAHNAAT